MRFLYNISLNIVGSNYDIELCKDHLTKIHYNHALSGMPKFACSYNSTYYLDKKAAYSISPWSRPFHNTKCAQGPSTPPLQTTNDGLPSTPQLFSTLHRSPFHLIHCFTKSASNLSSPISLLQVCFGPGPCVFIRV